MAELPVEDSVKGTPSNHFKNYLKENSKLLLLLEGQGISEVAETLHLLVSRVGTHKATAFEKLEWRIFSS